MKKFAITLMSLIFINLYHPTAFSEKPNQRMMNNQATHSLKSKNTLQLSIQEIMDKKDKKLVFIKLIDTKNNKPITLNDLIEAHTQKIHLLIIDDSLLDYSHVHPVETTIPGIYQFEWQPTLKSASYRAWADLIPTNTKTQEYVVADLP
ncbi:TPA: hypothetical protein U2L99_003337, partial [Legionella pneumophila]|nr:hypothetical protein [Legionella pneumophila]